MGERSGGKGFGLLLKVPKAPEEVESRILDSKGRVVKIVDPETQEIDVKISPY